MFYETTTEKNLISVLSDKKQAKNIKIIVEEGALITV